MYVYNSFCHFSHIVSSHNIVFQSYLGQLPFSPFSEIMSYICNIIRFIYCRLHSVMVPQSFWLVLFLSLNTVEYIHFCVQFFGCCKWRESGVCHQICWAAFFTKMAWVSSLWSPPLPTPIFGSRWSVFHLCFAFLEGHIRRVIQYSTFGVWPFFGHVVACGISVSQTGVKPRPSAVEV